MIEPSLYELRESAKRFVVVSGLAGLADEAARLLVMALCHLQIQGKGTDRQSWTFRVGDDCEFGEWTVNVARSPNSQSGSADPGVLPALDSRKVEGG